MINIGEQLPDIELESTVGSVNLSGIKDKNILVYFYPKDNTPGCTTEGRDFNELYPQFEHSNCLIFGISRDPVKSHLRFKDKQAFQFELISDPDEALCQAFGVIKLKKLYGREYMGVERSSFLFDTKGLLVKEWRKVRVKGHAEEVLEAAKEL